MQSLGFDAKTISNKMIRAFFTTIPTRVKGSCIGIDKAGRDLTKLPRNEIENISCEIKELYKQYKDYLFVDEVLDRNQDATYRLLTYYAVWIAKNNLTLEDLPKVSGWSKGLIDYFIKISLPVYELHKGKNK